MKDFSALAVPAVAGLTPYEPGRDSADVERQYGLTSVVKLASNENPIGPGRLAREALAAYEPVQLGRYPDNDGRRLKEALAAVHGLQPDQFMLGNGSSEVLNVIVRTFAGAGREVLFPRYSFIVFPLATLSVGAQVVQAPDVDYGASADTLLGAVTPRTRLLMLANPNNPTGHYLTEKTLRRLLERLPEQVIVVVDQAYFEYAQPIPGYPNAVQLLPEFPRLIVTGTFSKAYGLAGLRVGYAICHPGLAELLNRAREPFNVNTMAQVAAVASLSDDEHIRASLELNEAGRRRWLTALTELNLRHLPAPANFVCARFPGGGRRLCQDMESQGVIFRPLDNYGMPDWARISFGLTGENDKAVAALRQWVGRQRGAGQDD